MGAGYNLDFDAPYGEARQISPLIQRVLADNPSPFTFKGTGTYIVGAREVAVIDPGPLLASHIDALKRALAGRAVTHILITHTHADHSPAAAELKAWSGAKTYAFGPHPVGDDLGDEDGARVEEGGDGAFVPDIRVKHGDVLTVGGLTIDCLHTPGHISNHMCYALRKESALFTGDHVMGWSSTVISPPGGDMADYMASLDMLIGRRDAILYPTHGGPVTQPGPYLEFCRAHRLAREAEILACIRAGVAAIPDIVAQLYAGIDKRLHPAAARTLLAHLIKLERDGRVRSVGDGRYAPV